MKTQTILSASLIAISLLFSGCGTSPKAELFILNPIERDISAPVAVLKSISVKVGPISIPDTLDQSPIITRTGSNTLMAGEFKRWSGDYQSDIQRVLGENISILLPTDQITLGQEIVLTPIDFQVIVNIRQFDGQLGGVVTLNADWSVAHHGKKKSVIAKKSVFQEKANGSTYQDYVAAQSRLLAKLSQEISNTIKKQIK